MNTCPNCGPLPGVVTVMADVPLTPSLVAVMVAEPTAAPVTRPLALTVATPVLLLCQVTARPDRAVPLASLGVAVSCTVDPACTEAAVGATLTEATGTCTTVIAAEPLWLSLVAVIVAVPATLPVTSPLAPTVATVAVLLNQVTAPPASGLPSSALPSPPPGRWPWPGSRPPPPPALVPAAP